MDEPIDFANGQPAVDELPHELVRQASSFADPLSKSGLGAPMLCVWRFQHVVKVANVYIV